jgi:transcriptional regulator with XRE-family HTH domain
MNPVIELGQAVNSRRTDMGLTQAALAKLSGLSRATVNQVENGTVKDLSLHRAARLLGVLGLSVTISHPREQRTSAASREKTNALDLAARTASVSYRRALPSDLLGRFLIEGTVSDPFAPHLNALLEDAPVSLLASVIEQLHQRMGIERTMLWTHMRTIARQLQSRRDIWA